MEDTPIPLNLERSKAVKRMAQGESKDEYQTEELKEGPRLSHPTIDAINAIEVNHLVMSRLEVEEKKVMQVATDDYCMPSMPLTVIEESTDYSWVQSGSTKFLSEMMSCTDVGPLRDRLGEKLIQSLAEELIDPAAGGLCPEGTGEESIFDYGRLPPGRW